MEYRTAMIVAMPNSASVNPICRSRTTAWSAVRVSPRMLYSAVCASVSVGGVGRGAERFFNVARNSVSETGSEDADTRGEALAGEVGRRLAYGSLPESGDG